MEEERGIVSDAVNYVKGKATEYMGKAKKALGMDNQDQQSSDQSSDQQQQEEDEKKKGGGCGGGSGGAGCGDYSASDGQCHATPKTPKFKLEIEENDLPENWWDKLPDFDPRIYDAISMEQAEACVSYIFDGLPDMHELEHLMEARKFRKICPRLKTKVPRTKIVKPKEIIYDTTIDTFIKKDQTY